MREFERGCNHAQHEVTADGRVDDERVFTLPAKTCECRKFALVHRRGIDARAKLAAGVRDAKLVGQRVQATFDDIVVVATPRVAGDFAVSLKGFIKRVVAGCVLIGDDDERSRVCENARGVDAGFDVVGHESHRAVLAGGEPSAQVIAVRRGLRGGDAGEGEVELFTAREDVACGFVR